MLTEATAGVRPHVDRQLGIQINLGEPQGRGLSPHWRHADRHSLPSDLGTFALPNSSLYTSDAVQGHGRLTSALASGPRSRRSFAHFPCPQHARYVLYRMSKAGGHHLVRALGPGEAPPPAVLPAAHSPTRGISCNPPALAQRPPVPPLGPSIAGCLWPELQWLRERQGWCHPAAPPDAAPPPPLPLPPDKLPPLP